MALSAARWTRDSSLQLLVETAHPEGHYTQVGVPPVKTMTLILARAHSVLALCWAEDIGMVARVLWARPLPGHVWAMAVTEASRVSFLTCKMGMLVRLPSTRLSEGPGIVTTKSLHTVFNKSSSSYPVTCSWPPFGAQGGVGFPFSRHDN